MRHIMHPDLIGREIAKGHDWKDGAYQVLGPCGASLRIITSYGYNWDHVSVSLSNRNPNWQEMCYVKSLFWDEEETVVEYHIAKSQFVENHPYVLHLWKPQDKEILTPFRWMVGTYPGWEHDIPAELLEETRELAKQARRP